MSESEVCDDQESQQVRTTQRRWPILILGIGVGAALAAGTVAVLAMTDKGTPDVMPAADREACASVSDAALAAREAAQAAERAAAAAEAEEAAASRRTTTTAPPRGIDGLTDEEARDLAVLRDADARWRHADATRDAVARMNSANSTMSDAIALTRSALMRADSESLRSLAGSFTGSGDARRAIGALSPLCPGFDLDWPYE